MSSLALSGLVTHGIWFPFSSSLITLGIFRMNSGLWSKQCSNSVSVHSCMSTSEVLLNLSLFFFGITGLKASKWFPFPSCRHRGAFAESYFARICRSVLEYFYANFCLQKQEWERRLSQDQRHFKGSMCVKFCFSFHEGQFSATLFKQPPKKWCKKRVCGMGQY